MQLLTHHTHASLSFAHDVPSVWNAFFLLHPPGWFLLVLENPAPAHPPLEAWGVPLDDVGYLLPYPWSFVTLSLVLPFLQD